MFQDIGLSLIKLVATGLYSIVTSDIAKTSTRYCFNKSKKIIYSSFENS